jgi:hypothetical protein
MRNRILLFTTIILLFQAGSVTWLLGGDEEIPPFNFEEWKTRPESKDIPWNVWTTLPLLTYQQRNLVSIRAVINCGKLKNRGRERLLHFVLKVADAKNGWSADYDYTRARIFSRLDKAHEVQYVSGVYLRPGRFTFALMVYDDLTKLGSMRQMTVKVPPIKNDPLPELDRDLPSIQFISGIELERFDYNPSLQRQWEWPLAKGKEWLPVKNNRGVCIDIVISSTSAAFHVDLAVMHPIMLQMASVLSHLQLRKGCVRVTLLDTVRTRILFDRRDGSGFDWQAAGELLRKENPDKIDVSQMEAGIAPFEFLRDRLKLIAESAGCETETGVPLEVVLFFTPVDKLPAKTDIQSVKLKIMSSVRFFTFGFRGSDLAAMIKGIKPKGLSHRDGLEFRKTLASLISLLEKEY